MTIDKVELNKLKSYSGKTTQSFEQLIYSLMKKEYGELGKFTPIAGEGGDSGVEFYLDLPSGERWGWQCKWFDDNGRLSQSSRYTSIESSLETSCKNHANLTRWFLCLRTNLTVSMVTKTDKQKKGEREWFEQTLPLKIPTDRNIQIDFIGEDDIINLIGNAKNIGIRNFFFGELEVDQQWFANRFNESFEQVKDKYEPELHTMDEYIQSIIDFKLINPEYNILLGSTVEKLKGKDIDVLEELKIFRNQSTHSIEEKEIKEQGLTLFVEFDQHKQTAFEILKGIEKCILNYDIQALENLNFDDQQAIFQEYLDRLSEYTNSGRETIQGSAKITYFSISRFFEELESFLKNYIHALDNEIHFIASPAEGKTHTSCDIAYKRIQKDLPAVFLTGDKFNHETNLEQSILKLLDIPTNYNFEDLLTAINIYGSLAKVRIPFIIDGLNETVHNKLFSTIWRTHLPSLSAKIKRFPNLVIITTCRRSYKDEVWVNYNPKSFEYLSGFNNYQTTKEAIEKYFSKYHIKSDLNFSNLNGFKKPIFLRLFCEIKNPNWQSGNEVEVFIDDDSSDSLFETYFKQINTSVTLKYHMIRKNDPFIQNGLAKIARYLWENNAREISIADYYTLIDGPGDYSEETSKADILIKEGLIITRDLRSEKEFISITYELMSGYLIARYLIDNLSEKDFQPQKDFHKKVSTKSERHPLYENIIGELALLFPKHKLKMLHELYSLSEDKEIHSASINALWKLQSQYIGEKDVEIVRRYFREKPKSRPHIIAMCTDTITSTTHPLNVHFLSGELLKLDVWERDLSWTEYVRRSAGSLTPYVNQFEQQCKDGLLDSKISTDKLHLAAEYIQLFLVSTNRHLRDNTTRALYYYGRRYYQQFTDMTIRSLGCNDPYLWERTLAALYGVCMATHHNDDFQQNCLPRIANSLYEQLFTEQAPYYTTHALARDYAIRCIRIALIHNKNLLTDLQIGRITRPYPSDKPEPPMVEDQENTTFRPPLGMDFSNYTIGYIVEDGHSYSNPPEKQKVRRQILHRIEQFGWNEDRFKSIDESFARDPYNRHERPAVERYGKKYSRSAFFEIAGYRENLGLIPKDTKQFRISSADLDPSFPEPTKTEKFFDGDLLGDKSISLMDWLKTEDFPLIEEYLEPNLIDAHQFVCVDGYIRQNDEQCLRERFTFIRSLMVNEDEYGDLLARITKQSLKDRWLPEKHENTDAYAGEIYLFEDATYSNETTVEFIISSIEKTVKRGEIGYFPDHKMKKSKDGGLVFGKTYPKSKTITVRNIKEFEVLMPVMNYHGPSDNKEINKASSTTMLAKEIAMDLGLVELAQTFDLFDTEGNLACKNINYYEDSDNTHYMTYLRKDLLNKYLEKNKLKFFWAIWGEREPSLGYRRAGDFEEGDKIEDYFVFQKIIEYK
ncbi:hypothetical protein AQ505_08830 [Pedobacter sp. PACM 27299]|nr:hypothetical protein AQ505_08830 [Pedobacter sp. PACM 27299]